ncbi:unnamed protein product [Discula destructiva]
MSSPSPQPKVTIATLVFEDRLNEPPTKEKFRLHRNQTLKFGRDQRSNDFTLNSLRSSRNHLEFFTIHFDKTVQPMICVRDRQSNNGTYVNGKLIGKGPDVTPGRLLENGDVVSIKPQCFFTVKLPTAEPQPLSKIQTLEVKYFVDEYRISNTIIGCGASTTVRVAYDVKTGQQLACKIYDIGKMVHPLEVTKLMNGLEIMVQLEHPNITCFKRGFKSRYTLYVFEEIATGGDLFALSYSHSRFSELEIQWMMRQILLPVKYLHKKGVVHRDLKSENVLAMVCPQPAHRLALTDFGHADLVGSEHDSIGTRGWQAPEMFQKGVYTGRAADIWSIGIMAVHLLCGHREVVTLNALEEIWPKDPYFEDVDYEGITNEINVIRCESAAGQELRNDFIRRCLEPDQYKRMTAAEALIHPWLNESPEMRKLFNTRQEQNNKTWKLREIHPEMVGELPDVLAIEKRKKQIAADKTASGTSKSEPSPKKSPYFKESCKISKPVKAAKSTAASTEPAKFTKPAKPAKPAKVAEKPTEVTKPANAAPHKKDDERPETADTRTPRQIFQEMSSKERVRLFGKHGKYGAGAGGRPASLDRHLNTYNRAQRDRNKVQLLEYLRTNNLKFLPRSTSWPFKKDAAEKMSTVEHRKRAGSSGESGGERSAKRRKIVRDPSDGKPIDFKDPWTPK